MREITIQVVLRLRCDDESAAPRYIADALDRCAHQQLAFRDETASTAILWNRELPEVLKLSGEMADDLHVAAMPARDSRS